MEEITEDAEEAQTAAEEVAEDSVAVDEAVENEAVDEAVENEEASDQDTKKNLVFSLKVDHFTAHLVLTALYKIDKKSVFTLLLEKKTSSVKYTGYLHDGVLVCL